jgi:MSHA pilin protein MshD
VRRAGFSAIEVLVGIVVLAIVLPALLTGLYDLEARSGDARLRTIAGELAQDLLDEITSKAFEDPDLPEGSFGTEEGTRAAWDDVDDYDGFVQSPPTDAAGTAIGPSTYTRTVTVANVSEGALDTVVADGQSPVKRITISVEWSGATPVTLTVLKVRPDVASNAVSWIYVGDTRNHGGGKVEFDLRNQTGGDVSLTGLIAEWTAPVAYYEEIRIRVNGLTNLDQVWEWQDDTGRATSGQTITFTEHTPVFVPANATITVELRSFRPTQFGNGGGGVDMDSAALTLTLISGGTSYPDIAVPPAP